MKRKTPDSSFSADDRLRTKPTTSSEKPDLVRLWKGIPLELKLEILSNLPENYLWVLKERYPQPYYNQTKATCNPGNDFRILREASKGCVFKFLRELHVQQRSFLRSITPHLFPKLELLTIGVDNDDFQQLPPHHRLRTLKIRAPCLDLSFVTKTKFPSLEVLALYSLSPELASLPVLNITRLSIVCFTLVGVETLRETKLLGLRVLEITQPILDCLKLPVHNGVETFICKSCHTVENSGCLRGKFPQLQQLKIHGGVNLNGLHTEGLEIVVVGDS